ncbi:MAG TPA: Stk1 family PASTA domain-containing Ser/Thr kinase [Symbiobacteriaceae bacterium]|nr:Stk1 family PASTA domain-containing Ser/Thr kinase [Symbiobacteriaceae bacterium]
MVGQVLGNRYRIEERIGGGGMSVVFRATDLQLGRDVAVKVMRAHLAADEDFVRRFWREAQNAAALSHPNLVKIYDVGRDEENCFIVMELITGRTLKQMIQEQGPLPIDQAVKLAGQILDALGHAHEQKIIHRDVKPHNVLIARDGTVRVTDFGIARATTTDTVTHTGSILGSAHYFSPEQANGYPANEKSDLYSMGVVLYEMVTGRVPFQGESPITVAIKHIREVVTPPSALNQEVPAELDQIIGQALAKEPDERFLDAAEMRGALEQFLLDHAAGRTHVASGDFPTQMITPIGSRKDRRQPAEKPKAPIAPMAGEEEEEERPLSRKQKRRRALIFLIVLVLLGGLVGGAAYAVNTYLTVPTIDLPNVVGLPVGEAQTALRGYNLDSKVVSYVFDDKLPVAAVVRQDPPAGTPVKTGGRVIELQISKGPEQKEVPQLQGMTEEEAIAKLETEGFVKGKVTYKESSDPEGRVIDHVPGPKTIQKAGAQIDLVISKGRLKVPAVIGLKLDEAQRQIVAAGLLVGKVESRYEAGQAKDTVLEVTPPAGETVAQGATINLVVATDVNPNPGTGGGGTASTPFTKQVTIPAEAGKGAPIQIILVDQANGQTTERLLLESNLKAGQTINVRDQFQGTAYIKVIVNGTERQRINLP